MKNKINIALIALVLGLWGTVAYKHIYKYFASTEIINLESERSNQINFNEIKKDTFLLESISRDPFLNKKNYIEPVFTESQTKIEKPIAIKIPEVYKPEIICPNIEYFGFIKSNNKNDELILVKISNRLYKSRKNDLIEDVLLEKVARDSIVVFFNKKRKVVKLKKLKY